MPLIEARNLEPSPANYQSMSDVIQQWIDRCPRPGQRVQLIDDILTILWYRAPDACRDYRMPEPPPTRPLGPVHGGRAIED